MTLPDNPFATHSGVPQSSQEPTEVSSLSAPAGAPVMVAPAARPFDAAPLHTDAVSLAHSSRSVRGCTAAWMLAVCQNISLVHGSTPYRFDHLDDYVSRFSNPSFWLRRLIEIVVIVFAMLYICKGAAIARYVAICVILMLFFVVMLIALVINDSARYYAFMPEPGICEFGLLGACLLLMRVLDWVCVIAATLLAILNLKPAPSFYAMNAPVPATEAVPAGRVTSPTATPEGASSEATSKNSLTQVTNVSVFTASQ